MCYAATVRSNFVGYLHRKTLVWVFSQLSLGFFKWIASCFNTFKRLQLHLCSLSGFDSHSWKTQVKCVQKKYFSYIIDKIVSYRRNFSKILVIQAYFFFFLIIFITSIYQPCIPSGRFSKWAFSFLSHKNVQIRYFHGQYKANSLGTNETSFMSHAQSS